MLIHVGSRRSLSTWLRNEIFSNPNFYIIKGYLNKSRITKYFQYTDPAFIDLNELKKDVLQDIENAILYYQIGLELKPKDIIMNKHLAEIYLKESKFDLANEILGVLKDCNCKEYEDLKNKIKASKIN